MVAARCVEALQLQMEMVAHGGARFVNGAVATWCSGGWRGSDA